MTCRAMKQMKAKGHQHRLVAGKNGGKQQRAHATRDAQVQGDFPAAGSCTGRLDTEKAPSGQDRCSGKRRAQVKHAPFTPSKTSCPPRTGSADPAGLRNAHTGSGGTYLPHMPQHTDAPHALAHQRAQQRKHQELHTFTSCRYQSGEEDVSAALAEKGRDEKRGPGKGMPERSVRYAPRMSLRGKRAFFRSPGRFLAGQKSAFATQDAPTAVRAPGQHHRRHQRRDTGRHPAGVHKIRRNKRSPGV